MLQCPECNHQANSLSTFLTLSLDLPDVLENASESVTDKSNIIKLEDIMKAYVKPEILDDDNKWTCSGCSNKVKASKSQMIEQLPSRLLLHMKRFRFDPVNCVYIINFNEECKCALLNF
jgi:ubiquitin C-terminal hydrolase